MKLSRQGRPWKGEVPRKSGPVDPVENQRDVSQGTKGEGRVVGIGGVSLFSFP